MLDFAHAHTHTHTHLAFPYRHPYEWISSMQKHPYYAYMHEDIKMLDFVTREWISFFHGAGGQV